jgi:hypothetical protein
MEDIGSIVVVAAFILLTSVCVIAAKSLLGVSFFVACLIGGICGFLIGMLIVWLLGKMNSGRQ